MTEFAPMPDRAVLELYGHDRTSFLQGLVSNDVTEATPGHAVWTALLTPQGKYLADFFVCGQKERLLLDCAASQVPLVAQRLKRFRLRARVEIGRSDLRVHAIWGAEARNTAIALGGIAFADPRLPEAGWRVLTSAWLPDAAPQEAWDAHRLSLGLPDGPRDLEPDKTVLLEAGFDELHGISWTKGCYMGQELTARTRYRGLIKRRLVPVTVKGPLPMPGTAILRNGQEVGTLRSGQANAALATLKLDTLDAAALDCGDAQLRPRIPAWMRLGLTANS